MKKNPEVDEYIKNVPKEFRTVLTHMRELIFENLPEGGEVFAYKIPVYKYMGKALFSIAAFKDHYSIITQDKDIESKIPELQDYKISGTTIHFTAKKPITDALLNKIIQLRVSDRENSIR